MAVLGRRVDLLRAVIRGFLRVGMQVVLAGIIIRRSRSFIDEYGGSKWV